MAPHRRRTRTILGDRDPVPQQEEAVSRSSAKRDRRLPKTRPPYYVKSSATSSEYDWDDDTLDVDVRKSLDASGGDFVVPGADLHASSFAEPPTKIDEDSVPRRNTLRFDADADADAALALASIDAASASRASGAKAPAERRSPRRDDDDACRRRAVAADIADRDRELDAVAVAVVDDARDGVDTAPRGDADATTLCIAGGREGGGRGVARATTTVDVVASDGVGTLQIDFPSFILLPVT